MAKEEVYFSLGSNQGDSLENLLQAIILLSKRGIRIKDVSPIYLTEPVGYKEQPDFLNLVLRGETELAPMELLAVCKGVEQEFHRKRDIHWGPRTIDIDIILYGRHTISDPKLTLPHPQLKERAFVLVPLQDIAPHIVAEMDAVIPPQKITLLMAGTDVKMMLKQRNLQIN
jgi:2-amino-4-hydroxy-6-hydroxymethyldihydropteridine diphosphokinase